jgi:very-short-patch-repair endonuclease
LRLLRRLLALFRNNRNSWNAIHPLTVDITMVGERPFLGQEAVARGDVSAWDLRTRYRRVYHNVYVEKEAQLTAADRARAAWLWCGGEATLIGRSAAAVHGTKWIHANLAAELCRPDRRHPAGIKISTFALQSDDICWVDAMRLTTPERTAFDIGRLHLPDKSVPVLDALVAATNIKVADIKSLAADRLGVRGARRLRTALELVDGGAESPQESRLRLILMRGGLPRPQTQICFSDVYGNVLIRVDMGWPEWKVAVEYDGEQHWTDARQRAWDIERLVIAEAEGWAVVRVSSDMMSRPNIMVERVAQKLRDAGWPG